MKFLGITALSALALGVAFRCALGCSGDTVVETDAASPPGGSDGAPRRDSFLDDATEAGGDGGGDGQTLVTDAGRDGQTLVTDAGAISWDGRAPLAHRDAAVACPPERDEDAGLPCPESTSLPGNPCVENADCTGGQNGRCLCSADFGPPDSGNPNTLYNKTVCSYDQCFADTDCHPRVPCDCRDVNTYGNPNLCLTASHCAVDSDCPAPGFCSPSGVFDHPPGVGYFCHTPNDTCIDDVDCPRASITTCECEHVCVVDEDSGVWGCVSIPERL